MGRRDRLTELMLFSLAAVFAGLGYGWPTTAAEGFILPARSASQLRVVTWNVGGTSATGDGQPLNSDWLTHIADTLRALDPDIVFLQEVRNGLQLIDLRRHLGRNWKGMLTHRGDRRLAVLYQRGTLKPFEFAMGKHRSVMAVNYQAPGLGPVAAVALHADAFSARRRNREIGRAVDILRHGPSASARMLVGDLNIDLDLDKRRDLFSNNEHLDVESYNYITTHFFDVGIGRGATAKPDRRVDYIFVNAELAVATTGPWKQHRIAQMDHDPLMADLQFVNRSAGRSVHAAPSSFGKK